MARGGRRPGAGRKPGGRNPKGRVIDKRAQEFAAKISKLPHEVLYQAGIDGELDGEVLTLPQRLDCLKSVASYFAPKLSDNRTLNVNATATPENTSPFELARRIAYTLALADQQQKPETPALEYKPTTTPTQPMEAPVVRMVASKPVAQPLSDEQLDELHRGAKREAEDLKYALSRPDQRVESDQRPAAILHNPRGRWGR